MSLSDVRLFLEHAVRSTRAGGETQSGLLSAWDIGEKVAVVQGEVGGKV